MNVFLEKLAAIIDTNTLISIALTVVFCYLSVNGKITTEFMSIYSAVIGFYFGSKITKDSTETAVMRQ